VVQKIPNATNWADVLVNLKYKYFKARVADKGKMVINIFKQHKNLMIYFPNEEQLGQVFTLINERKTTILLRELSLFSDKLIALREMLEKRQLQFSLVQNSQ
jgi:hypothetical protein